MANSTISIQFAIKIAAGVKLVQADVPLHFTVGKALQYFCEAENLELNSLLNQGYATSVFGKKRNMDFVLRAGDRLEFCAPLIATPMLSRRLRAKREHKGGKM